ncbi:MAG: hypothetical protein GZ091_15320 [Paludibacter sp.]|nr:hypothetical protein [Paludibacter sp.]
MQRPLIQNLLLLLFAIQLSSCITTHHTNYLQETKNFIPSYNDSVSYQDYLIKEDDRLFIQVYSMDDKTNALFNGSGSQNTQLMSGTGSNQNLDLFTYIVHSDGNIIFPLVGEIYLKGKTIRQAKDFIETAIKPILVINSVDVRMVGRTFSVIGAGKSGKFTFPREKVNIYQAIAMAGDLGFYVDRSKIKILRETENGSIIKTFDVRSIDIINSEYYYLEPNDVIFIQPLKEQFFGVSTIWSAISTLVTTYSFGVIIYNSFIK